MESRGSLDVQIDRMAEFNDDPSVARLTFGYRYNYRLQAATATGDATQRHNIALHQILEL
jgi:hypothetical protein